MLGGWQGTTDGPSATGIYGGSPFTRSRSENQCLNNTKDEDNRGYDECIMSADPEKLENLYRRLMNLISGQAGEVMLPCSFQAFTDKFKLKYFGTVACDITHGQTEELDEPNREDFSWAKKIRGYRKRELERQMGSDKSFSEDQQADSLVLQKRLSVIFLEEEEMFKFCRQAVMTARQRLVVG
ncbi:hypothetical protein SUGI_0989460 [Cryptomeria japonica]|nr:hypothetical protein SUGI_0989460 [Cryptomeria japonica]